MQDCWGQMLLPFPREDADETDTDDERRPRLRLVGGDETTDSSVV